MTKIPRSRWLPALLLVYLLAMTVYFGIDWIRAGDIARVVLVVCSELLIIALLHFFLKKREEQRSE